VINLNDAQHTLVKTQLQRLEWSGTEGRFCPECGGSRPVDKIDREGEPLKDGRLPMKSGILCPDPLEGHHRNCSLASAIMAVSSPDRIVVFCQNGDPKGFEAGK
jgi:hypothetical protein